MIHTFVRAPWIGSCKCWRCERLGSGGLRVLHHVVHLCQAVREHVHLGRLLCLCGTDLLSDCLRQLQPCGMQLLGQVRDVVLHGLLRD